MEGLANEDSRRAPPGALTTLTGATEIRGTIRLAARNVRRQRMRTAMTLAAIVFGVIGIIVSGGFVRDILVQLGEGLIHSQSGHLQIARSGFFTLGSRKPDQYVITEPDEIKRRVVALPETDDVMARLNFSGLLTNGRTDFAIVGEGVEPDKETRLGTHLVLTAGRQLSDKDQYGMLIGEGVARTLKLDPGNRAVILLNTADGAMNTLEFEVVGVFRTFSKDYDARAVKIPLSAAQQLLDTKGVNVLVTSLKRTRDTDGVAKALTAALGTERLEVKRWDELNDFYAKTVDLYNRQFGVLQLIILAMVLLSVMNTVNMTVFERTGEFGTMRALGSRGKAVVGLILTESVLLGLIGAAVGVAIGILLALVISAVGIPMPPPPNSDIAYTAQIRIVPSVIANAFFVGAAATVLAAVLPAFRVARTDVVEALRHNV